MNQKVYSTKQIAEELGTTKQRVYRCIKKNCIKETRSEVVNGNTVLMYDEAAFTKISELLGGVDTVSDKTHEAHQDVHRDVVNEAVYEALVKQLEIKDKQIEALQKALDEERELVKEAHALIGREQNKLTVASQQIIELEDKLAAVNQEEASKKKWWQKIFS